MKIGDFTGEVKIGDGMVYRNCMFFPLTLEKEMDVEFKTVEELVKENLVEIKELDRSTVGSIRIRNRSSTPLFLLDGEIFAEALQTRVVNTSLVIDGMQDVVIPVSCVEAHRWSGKKEFTSTGMCSNISLRKELTRSLIRGKKFSSDQARIWRAVETTLTATGVRSSTSSLYDVYRSYQSRGFLPEEEEILPLLEYNGLVCAAGGSISAMDLFCSKKLFRKVARKLIAGYIIETLASGSGRLEIKKKEIEKFVNHILELNTEKVELPTKNGFELRFSSELAFGKALIHRNSAVHTSSFSN